MKQNRKLKIVAMDPSMRNWGLAIVYLDLDTYEYYVDDLLVIRSNKDPKKAKKKSVRDMMTVEELLAGLIPHLADADVVIAEIPIGGRDSSAALSYSICISILAMINFSFTKVFEVTPHEVKLNVVKNATKQQMITWATKMHPEAPWQYRKYKGDKVIINSFAEHVSDAIGALYASIKKPAFYKLIQSFKETKK